MSDSAPPPYGGPPPGSYPPGAYQPGPYGSGGDHPQSTTILVLGILGLVVCQVLSPFAWVMGSRALAEIDASGGRLGGRNAVQAGRICGIVGTVLLGLSVVVLLFIVVIAFAGVSTAISTS